MYPRIDVRGQMNNGKNWDVKVPIKVIRKRKNLRVPRFVIALASAADSPCRLSEYYNLDLL